MSVSLRMATLSVFCVAVSVLVFLGSCSAQDYGQPAAGCVCPKGYSSYNYQIMMLGQFIRPNIVMSCIAAGEPTKACPKGSAYDSSIDQCISPVLDGDCPPDMWKAFYRDECLADRVDLMSCPEGGQYDGVFGACVAPCGSGQAKDGENPEVEEVNPFYSR